MKRFVLERAGSLYSLKAALRSGDLRRHVTLIIDTGASRILVSRVRLELMGYTVAKAATSQKMVTANRVVHAPVITVDYFSCLGKTIEQFNVVAYDLPPESHVEGLLGMDFLSKFDYSFALQRGVITVR